MPFLLISSIAFMIDCRFYKNTAAYFEKLKQPDGKKVFTKSLHAKFHRNALSFLLRRAHCLL